MPKSQDARAGHDHAKMLADGVAPTGSATAIDPVCGMTVTLNTNTRTENFDGKSFHFCSEKCQAKFKGDPWFYGSGNAAKRGKVAAVGVQYTCPMHPQIIRDAPGSCPICGMALEPITPSDAPSEELTDFTRRMWISAAVGVPLVVLTMGPLVGLPVRDWVGHKAAMYLEFLLATPIILWAAMPFFKRGWESVVNRSPNMWTLISLGVLAAYGYSLLATFLPGVFPEQYRMGGFAGMRTQAAVGDAQFLRSMIPHHSGAILMCEQASLTDPKVIALCAQIIPAQKAEIAQMKAILQGYSAL